MLVVQGNPNGLSRRIYNDVAKDIITRGCTLLEIVEIGDIRDGFLEGKEIISRSIITYDTEEELIMYLREQELAEHRHFERVSVYNFTPKEIKFSCIHNCG